ncbi:MAG: dihydrofolate reductase [Patescibacteria group bacterium]
MKLSLIVGISENNVIGKDNKLPWHLSVDLKRFKRLTTGHSIIMGRKTYDSIGRPLPNRTNIVITRDPNYGVEGVMVAHSLDEAVKIAQKSPGSDEVFVIGGAQIFQEALKIADKLYLTIIHKQIEGDVYFPDYASFNKVISQEDGSEGEYNYSFIDLERESDKIAS